MTWHNEAAQLLQHQYERYPRLQVGDLLKALHQSVCGCGHLIEDPAAAAAYIEREAATARSTNDSQVEPLGSRFCRLHLDYLKETGLKPQTLANLFALSAQADTGGEAQLREGLETLLSLIRSGSLPFSYEEAREAASQWQQEGFPARRHTEAFRAAYAPTYRVLFRDYARFLPLFAAIDRALEEKNHLLVAIEGGAAAGKSTLGQLLTRIYDCNLFHMDDFFLRPGQRTPERFQQPGGNVDHERFLEEVLAPLTRGETVRYRRFDCGTFLLQTPVEIMPKALNIVEGAYSCHPRLTEAYDLKVFLKVDPETQAARIRKRNNSACQARFFETWLPLEQIYFETFHIEEQCDLILEVDG